MFFVVVVVQGITSLSKPELQQGSSGDPIVSNLKEEPWLMGFRCKNKCVTVKGTLDYE